MKEEEEFQTLRKEVAMATKGKVFPAVSDITLDDCMLMYGKVPGIEDWYEDHY